MKYTCKQGKEDLEALTTDQQDLQLYVRLPTGERVEIVGMDREVAGILPVFVTERKRTGV